ncbi:MAG: hypothetical protein AB2551_04170 [Candidatus Thiodiazotropha sp.]
MAIPNEQRTMPSGVFSGAPHIDKTVGAGAVFPPTVLSLAQVEERHFTDTALPDEKIVPAGLIGFMLTGPGSIDLEMPHQL